MDLGTAFLTLEALLPDDDEAKMAFDKVRRKIYSSVGAEKVAELEAQTNAIGVLIRLLATHAIDPSDENKSQIKKFIQTR